MNKKADIKFIAILILTLITVGVAFAVLYIKIKNAMLP